jgi:ABC-2 type transport system permease protein
MKGFSAALWAEWLKVRRSTVPIFTTLGFSILPMVAGLFMIILRDPVAARSMGLITAKAQIMAGSADWPSFLGIMSQSIAVGGAILFSIITIWVFGREFSDRTAKELLALPTRREAIVTAKFLVVFFWALGLSLLIFGLGLLVGNWVNIPGWSRQVLGTGFGDSIGAALITTALLPVVAFLASTGRGDLLPFGWIVLSVVLAQIATLTGWGDWFPWAVPALFGGVAGPRAELIGFHSYVLVIFVGIVGLGATYYWWRTADQTR